MIKLNDLKKCAKEINALEIFDEDIKVTATEKELTAKVKEAIQQMDEDEVEELSEKSQDVVEELMNPGADEEKPKSKKSKGSSKKSKKVEETEEDEDDEDDDEPVTAEQLKEKLEDIDDVEELKTMVKEMAIFEPVRKGIALQKNADKLKVRMLGCLGAEEKPKKEKKAKATKTAKVEKTDVTKPKKEKKAKKKSRMVCICDTVKDLPKKGMDIDKFVSVADEYAGEQGNPVNEPQTKHTLKVIMPVLIEFGVVKFEDGKLIPTN